MKTSRLRCVLGLLAIPLTSSTISCDYCEKNTGKELRRIVNGWCMDSCFDSHLEDLLLSRGFECGTCEGMAATESASGTESVSAKSVSGSSSSQRSASKTATRICPDDRGPQAGYSMCLDLLIENQDRLVFEEAARIWSSKIKGDVEDVETLGRYSGCGGSVFPRTIDDLYICGIYSNMDGAGGVVGSATITHVRTTNGLPVAGKMEFDEADVDMLRSYGVLEGVVLHEMGHMLGIGSLWDNLDITGDAGGNCPYYGENANREWRAISGCRNSVPTELDGGRGTRCSHFDEHCLGNEIMTGWLNGEPKFSRITMGAIADLGYEPENYAAVSDPFGHSDIHPSCRCNRRLGEIPTLFENRKTRPLSAAGRALAMAYGKELLARARYDGVESMEGVEFVGDRFASVMFWESDELHLVEVFE